MFTSLIKKYVLVFILTFSGYTFLNWFASLHSGISVNKDYADLWIPAIICYLLAFIVFRPVLKKLGYNKKVTGLLLYALIPVSMWLPIALSQGYFRDISYTIIPIDQPKELDDYPNERFFKINHFVVDTSRCFLIRERHTSGKFGSALQLNSYFVVPVFNDTTERNNSRTSRIGYGVKFSASLANDLLYKSGQQKKVAAFWQRSKEDFSKYNFYQVDYFEKIENTDDAKYLLEAENNSPAFDKTAYNIILMNRSGTIQDLYAREQKTFLYSTLIFFGIALLTLYGVHRYQMRKISNYSSLQMRNS
ncbi:MAG TPA: hypothetical protein VG847_06760 [Chitinophagaceae bacterium]|nr:hypothetical protein [Chitinophagaceae bacterium]